MSTPADLYYAPLRVVITIRDVSNDPTYLIHNSFAPPEPSSGSPSIYYCDVDLAYGQSGTFTIKINDPESQLDPTRIGLGNRVWIQAGRTPDKLFNLLSGICETFQPIRGNYGLLGYVMTGMGTQQILNERVVNFLRSAQRRVGNVNKPFYDDPAMKANLLFKDLLERTDVIPTNFPAIKHTLYPGQFNTSDLVDGNVDTFIASLTEPYVEASQVANSIADMAGAIWGVEPGAPNQPDKVFLRFPSTTHSGILIKDKPEDAAEYTAKNVSYVRAAQGGWSFTDSRRKEDGFTNKIFSKTGADQVSGTASEGADNSTALIVDVAQQITINSTQLRDIAVTFHTTGVGQTVGGSSFIYNLSTVSFRIVNDDFGRPGATTELRSAFEVPDTGENVRTLFLKLPQEHTLKTLKPGDKAWLIFFAEAGVLYPGDGSFDACGQVLEENSASWHHDGGTTGTSAIRTACFPKGGTRSPAFADTASGWVVNNAGPTYSHLFFDSFSHIVEAADQDSINKYGEVDSFIDATWITDEDTMSQFLASVLQYAAKPRRIYEMTEVFIPYSSILMPGQLVTVVDTKAGFSPERNTVAEVQEVRYEFSAESPGKDPLGAHTCEIRLLGYVDYKEQFILIHQPDVISLPPPPPGTGPPGQLPTTYIQYFGGPFMNIISPSIHLIFWGTAWNSGAPATLKATMETQIQSIIDSVYFTELSQYGNIKVPNYGGSVVHTATPTSIIGTDGYTSENLRTVVNAAMTAGQVPNADSFKGPTMGNIAGFDYNHIYVVFVPPGFLLQNVPGDPIFIGSGIQSFKRTGTAANAAYSVVGITHAPTRFPTNTLTEQQQVMTATFTHEVVPALSSPRAVLTPVNNESAYNFKMSGLPSGFFPGDTLVKDNHQSSNLLGTNIKVACYWSDRNGTEVAPGTVFGIPIILPPPSPPPPGPPPSPPPGPPSPPPPPAGQIGPYAGTGRQLSSTTRRATRHYASGKPDDETIEKNTTNIPYQHYQCIYFVTMHGIEHDDNVSSKLGGTHMGSGWHDHGVSFNAGKTCLGTEPNHPDTNACIKVGANIGSIIEKRTGICTIWRKPSKHTELWTKSPGGNWIKRLENTGALGGFTPNNSGNDEAQLRIDGFEDGDDPTIDTAIVQEIAPA